MTIRVLAFARLRELLGRGELCIDLAPGAAVAQAWSALCAMQPAIAPLAESTRFGRNGHLVSAAERLADGDELALLPPVGGG
ncbi:MAG TPA: MoaD/ThiS family protein [Candidatus Acidoferrales bacterium]|nr:MoaD/ThiS family protein [Candidatus Acidoferrales bacterium]